MKTDQFLERIYALTHSLLVKEKGYAPFGVALLANDKLLTFMPDAEGVAEEIFRVLLKDMNDAKYQLAAYVDLVSFPEGDKKVDAVSVTLLFSDQTTSTIYVPFVDSEGRISYGKSVVRNERHGERHGMKQAS